MRRHKRRKLLQEMHDGKSNVEPNTVSYSSVIDAYAKRGAPKEATKLLYEMDSLVEAGNHDVKPNVISYTSAIAAWTGSDETNAGDEAEALLWRMMEQSQYGNEDVSPNSFTVAAVMRVWSLSEEAEAPERVEALLQWMKGQHEMGNTDIKPVFLNFHYALETWAKSRRVDAVQRIKSLLQDMLEDSNDEVHPDYQSYNMLLLALRNSAEADKAVQCYDVLQHMVEASKSGNSAIAPNRFSYHLVLGACASARTWNDPEAMAKAAAVLRDTFHAFTACGDLKPTYSTCKILMRACSVLGNAVSTELLDEIRGYCEASREVKCNVQPPIEDKQYFWQRR